MVTCIETGEHIDPEYVDVFINNLKKLTNKYLVISWASQGGVKDPGRDPLCQHLNPLPLQESFELLTNSGFHPHDALTRRFNKIICDLEIDTLAQVDHFSVRTIVVYEIPNEENPPRPGWDSIRKSLLRQTEL